MGFELRLVCACQRGVERRSLSSVSVCVFEEEEEGGKGLCALGEREREAKIDRVGHTERQRGGGDGGGECVRDQKGERRWSVCKRERVCMRSTRGVCVTV